MVEIHDGERPFQAVGGKEVDELDNPTPLKPRSRHPLDRDYLSGATLSDEIPTVLRSDPQIRGSHGGHGDPPPYSIAESRRAEGKSAHVKEGLGKRVAPYDERIPSSSPDRSQAQGDVRDCHARHKENHRHEVQEESSDSFYNLAYIANRRERRRHREEVYERRPFWAVDPPVVVTLKAPQTKVEMMLEHVTTQKIEKDIDSLLSLKKTSYETTWQYVNRYWDMFNEIEGCVQYQKVAKDMDDLMLRIDQHCQMTEDMAAHWKVTRGFGKTELSKGGLAVHNIQKGKGKDRWGEQGGCGSQREYIRGPKPHEFEAGPTVFKDPLHELLKKIEHEPYFSYPTDDIPYPMPKDNKYRCSYHAKRGHLI
ncbi:hypothetical protein RHSIM_Rhsim03G0134800 [Rhododendron simsii]|uniref:Uncharacterized protein n=1 Tax=Rhododendron simsii TaxID=118357 RepID=A0A834LUM8_RHOSS|nr:hypothetical protein RHSIM_Rhsim03G0134800 [Rhododendron simsii]